MLISFIHYILCVVFVTHSIIRIVFASKRLLNLILGNLRHQLYKKNKFF